MRYKEIESLIEDICEDLPYDVFFHSGRLSDLNKTDKDKSIIVWLVPMTSNGSFTNDVDQDNETYTVILYVFKYDNLGSITTEYMPIIHSTDDIVKTLRNEINKSNPEDGEIYIKSYSTEPTIKMYTDCLTGTIMRMSVYVSDTYKHCCA